MPAPSTAIALAGTRGRVQIGSVNLTQAKWSVKPKGNYLPSTNFESVDTGDLLTYAEGIFGILECDVSFSGLWDAAANPHSTFLLISGTIIDNVKIFLDKRDIFRCFTFVEFAVVDVSVDDDVTGMLMVSVNGKSNGVFSYPV